MPRPIVHLVAVVLLLCGQGLREGPFVVAVVAVVGGVVVRHSRLLHYALMSIKFLTTGALVYLVCI